MRKNKYSDLKIVWFPDKLRSFMLECITPPIYVRIKPTNKCNHNCWFCVYNPSFADMHHSMNRRDEIPKDTFLKIIDDLGDLEVRAITFSGGGEPLCHPFIEEATEKALDRGIKISIITNGQLLQGKKSEIFQSSEWVRISANYYNENSFMKSRVGTSDTYKKLIENIGSFGSEKKTADFGVNFIITKENVSYLEEAYSLFRDLSIDNIRFSPMWTTDLQGYHENIKTRAIESIEKIKKSADIEVYDSYSNVFEGNKPRSYKKCFISQIVPVVAADGFVYACHNMSYEPSGKISDENLKDKSFKDIWYSSKARNFFNTFDPSIECTGQCSNDHKNINIYNLLTGYGDPFI